MHIESAHKYRDSMESGAYCPCPIIGYYVCACILTFHLLFDTFCDIEPVLKEHKGENNVKNVLVFINLDKVNVYHDIWIYSQA